MSSFRVCRSLFALSTAGALILGGCKDSSPTASRAGTLSLLLTDAPGDVRKAVITIAGIYLPSAGGEIALRETPVTTDLVTLANSTADLVKDAVIPAGSYTQLRFLISGGYIEAENADGSTSLYASSPNYVGLPAGARVSGTLQMPSLAQSGLKVNLPGGAVSIAGDSKVILIDFDVARSFGKAAGNSGQWVMQPTVTATDLTMTGAVTVTLARADTVTLPLIDGARVTLGQYHAVLSTIAGAREELALTDANSDGVFDGTFRFLTPGTYQVDLRAPSDSVQYTTRPTRPTTVTVGSGATATQAFVITSARK
jgi:hypothetical protein